MKAPKRLKEPSAYPRVDNHQKFSTIRLIPVINQKNYFTNYLKKDSQYSGRKIRERSEGDDSKLVVIQLGSQHLKVGFADDSTPKVIPFCSAKPQDYYGDENEYNDDQVFEDGLTDVNQSFVDRMKFYKTRIVSNALEVCKDFNRRQQGTPAIDQEANGPKPEATEGKIYCQDANIPTSHKLFWPLVRGFLNEDPHYYRSPQELSSDMSGVLKHVMSSEQGLGITDLASGKYDVIIVSPDMLSRTALDIFVDLLFSLGFANLAIIQEAVAATYGAGISTACVVDVGAQTTTVSCVDDGACVADSRVKLDFGGDDITKAFRRLSERINLPGNPDALTMEKLKQKYVTVNEADISVQSYQYYQGEKKYDFKVYNEVMLPVSGLFYPDLYTSPPQYPWRFSLFPRSMDPYSSHTNEPISDADINIRMNTLAVLGQSYQDATIGEPTSSNENGENDNEEFGDVSVMDADDQDDQDMSREVTPMSDSGNSLANKEKENKEKDEKSSKITQMHAFESSDPRNSAVVALDHAIIESIKQAEKLSGTPKQYYENSLVIGGGAKISSFHALLRDRLMMWNQSRLKDIGEVAVMAMPRDMEPEFSSWCGGCVYSNLKVIDEMWTTKAEWDILGKRALHHKAALYIS